MTSGKASRAKGVSIDLSRPCIEHTQKGPRYGRVWHRGRLRAQHVQAWELANGREVPDGWQVDHLCFNPRCILPAHLEAVPPLVNHRRRRDLRLTVETARQIRAEYAELPRAERYVKANRPLKTDRPARVTRGAFMALCQKYGLAPRYMREIVDGDVWADG